MKASVIIPYYERFHHLEQTLQAISSQSEKDYEIIVIDDGSSQSIEKLIPSHVRLIRTSHRGAAAARNSGIAVAKGEILKNHQFFHSKRISKEVYFENFCRKRSI